LSMSATSPASAPYHVEGDGSFSKNEMSVDHLWGE
jgi:hypothetical protein